MKEALTAYLKHAFEYSIDVEAFSKFSNDYESFRFLMKEFVPFYFNKKNYFISLLLVKDLQKMGEDTFCQYEVSNDLNMFQIVPQEL